MSGWKAGDRVTAPFACGCGTCDECLSGNQQVCPDQSQPGFARWGSFAESVAIDHADESLVAIPDSMSFTTAAVRELTSGGAHVSIDAFGSAATYRYSAMLEMIEWGRLAPDRPVRRRISLDQAVEALVSMDRFDGVDVTVIDSMQVGPLNRAAIDSSASSWSPPVG